MTLNNPSRTERNSRYPWAVLATDCMACNRLRGSRMCELCADLEQAERDADTGAPDERNGD